MNKFWVRYREVIGYWFGVTLTLFLLVMIASLVFAAAVAIQDILGLKHRICELEDVLNGRAVMVDKSGREVYAKIEWKEVSK